MELYNFILNNKYIVIASILFGILIIRSLNKMKVKSNDKEHYYKYKRLGDNSYLFRVFIERIRYRPSVLFFYVIIFILLFPLNSLVTDYFFNKVSTLDEMYIKIGTINNLTRYKGISNLHLKDSNGKEYMFYYNFSENDVPKLLNKEVKIYFQELYSMPFVTSSFIIEEIYLDEKYIEDYMEKGYKNSLIFKKKLPTIIGILIFIILINIFMVWKFNHKELPIHRLNRIKLLNFRT